MGAGLATSEPSCLLDGVVVFCHGAFACCHGAVDGRCRDCRRSIPVQEGAAQPKVIRTIAEAYGHIDEHGRRVLRHATVPEEFLNPWSEQREQAFINHYQQYLDYIAKHPYTKSNTYFENEKKSYGLTMLTRLVGHRDQALKALQAQDHQHQQWHRETLGIDYYALASRSSIR